MFFWAVCCCCRRVRGDPYYQLLDELLMAVRRRFGNTVVVQFEDMTYDNASKLLNMYRWVAQHRWQHRTMQSAMHASELRRLASCHHTLLAWL